MVVVSILAMTLTSQAQDASKAAIRANGAAISSDQVQLWAKAFMEANPGSQITVTGSSAGKGFASFLDRNTDIVIASRVISADEQQRAVAQGMQLGERLIGNSGIAVITTPKNPVPDLSMTQLRKIFSGEYTNWREVGGPDAAIRCLTKRVPESGAALFFQEKVLDKQPYGATTTVAESWGTIIKVCSTATDFPIGIAPVIPALAASDKIKILGVKTDEQASSVKPSDETLKNKTYPIILVFRFYWDEKTASDQARKFVEFCASKGHPSQD
jgi:phosphate transport system substrate-binding protein